MRMDFIIDPAQVYESKVLGASAILLIASMLEKDQLHDLLNLAQELELAVIVESGNENDIEKAIECNPDIYGINNRSLETLSCDLGITGRLVPFIPGGKIIVTESCIVSKDDVARLMNEGCGRLNAMLVGSSIMQNKSAESIRDKIVELTDF